jgi:hypothetical protein
MKFSVYFPEDDHLVGLDWLRFTAMIVLSGNNFKNFRLASVNPEKLLIELLIGV